MNHNISEIQDLNELSNRDSRSNYSIVSEDLGQQLLQLIQEYQPNQQDQYLLELSKQKTVLEIDEKFHNSHVNNTYVFPRKVTQRDRNKAKELSQILANCTQKVVKCKQQPSQQNQGNISFSGINRNQSKQQNANNSGQQCVTEQTLPDLNNDTDDSFSSLTECTFYDLNSQNNISQNKTKAKPKQQQKEQGLTQHNLSNVLKKNQNEFVVSHTEGNQDEEINKIKHSYYAPHHLQKQQQSTQFVKQMINSHYQQSQQSANSQLQAQYVHQQNKHNMNQQQYPDNFFKDSDMINIEIQHNEQEEMIDHVRQNDENKNVVTRHAATADNQTNLPKNSKTLMNNLVQTFSGLKKVNASSTKSNGLKDFMSLNTNQILAAQQSVNIPQRRPLTEASPNAKNFNHLNQTAEILQGISSSTGTTTILGEQIASSKNKGSIAISNKSDNNLKNPRITTTQVKGVFTEADEEDEDTQTLLRDDWKDEIKVNKLKLEQDCKPIKIGHIATEGDELDKSPSKQYYNIPTQLVNAKVRKLKIASFHHQQRDNPNKLTQSVSIHNYTESNNNNNNIPNTANSFLPFAFNQQQITQLKGHNQQQMNFDSNSQKQNAFSNYPYDLNDIQVNNNLTSKSVKQNNTFAQQSAFQPLLISDQQNFNKLINFPQTTSNVGSAQKQFSFNIEGKLAKGVQSSTQGTGLNNNNNYSVYNNLPNTTNIQNSKLINLSHDFQYQENRITPIRSNKIPHQLNKLNQSQQVTSNIINNNLHTNEDVASNNGSLLNNNNLESTLSKSHTKSRNINATLSTTKGAAAINDIRQNQQEFTPTPTQNNQLNNRNKTSIRKLRPKINTESSLIDFNDPTGSNSKEQHNVQQFDPSPYTQAAKHMRNLTLNNYYLKSSSTKNSHTRQPSDNLLRNSIANRAYTDKSEEKLKTSNISQSNNNGIGGTGSSNKVLLTESVSVNNNRCPPSGNSQKVKRTLKIQSCKYNSQKNQLLQDSFKPLNQKYNNLTSTSKNAAQLSNLLLTQEDEVPQIKNFYKLEQPKQLSFSKKDNNNNSCEVKKIEKINVDQNQQLNQLQVSSTKNQNSKDIQIKEMLKQTNARRHLKTDGDELTEGNQNDNILFSSNNTFDKNALNQILLHKNYSTNGDFAHQDSSGKKVKSKQYVNQPNINIATQQQSNTIEDKVQQQQQQSTKCRSEENKLTLVSAQANSNNQNNPSELNKKRIIYKTNSIGKSLTSTQPLTIETHSSDNVQQSQQQSEQVTSVPNKLGQKITHHYVKQASNQNIKNSTKVQENIICEGSNNQSNIAQEKESESKYGNAKVKSTLIKGINGHPESNIEQESAIKQNQQIYKKSDQLNQILVNHVHKEVKQQPYSQNVGRQIKKTGLNTSYHIKSQQNNTSNYDSASAVKNQPDNNQGQTRKVASYSLHDDNFKSYTIESTTKPPSQQKEIQEQLQQKQDQDKINILSNNIAIGGQIQKIIHKSAVNEYLQVKQTNNATRLKGSQLASSLSASTDQSSNIVSNPNSGTGVSFGGQATASSTQSNQSKNKSPIRYNYVSPTNNQIPQPPQHPQSTRNQNGAVNLYKKKTHQLYSSVSGQPSQQQQQANNISSYQ